MARKKKSAGRREYHQAYYILHKKPTLEPEKPPRKRYRCAMCGFYTWDIDKLGSYELKILLQKVKGFKDIRYTELDEIDKEYIKQVKAACKEILEDLK